MNDWSLAFKAIHGKTPSKVDTSSVLNAPEEAKLSAPKEAAHKEKSIQIRCNALRKPTNFASILKRPDKAQEYSSPQKVLQSLAQNASPGPGKAVATPLKTPPTKRLIMSTSFCENLDSSKEMEDTVNEDEDENLPEITLPVVSMPKVRQVRKKKSRPSEQNFVKINLRHGRILKRGKKAFKRRRL